MKTPSEAKLAELLGCLEATVDPRRQAEIDEHHGRALAWEPVDRLPV